MLAFCLIIVFSGFLFLFISAIKNGVSDRRNETFTRQEQSSEENFEQHTEKVISYIVSDFNNAGWDNWDSSVHRETGQYERLEKAVTDKGMFLSWYNPIVSTAKISSSSGRFYLTNGFGCSCPDFRERRLPCKHMYFLAINLDEYESVLASNKIAGFKNYEDTALWGLEFCLSGKGQKVVKEYILKHCGSFGKYSGRNITAVIAVDEVTTNTILRAQMDGIQVMSFNDLQTLVSERKEKTPTAD